MPRPVREDRTDFHTETIKIYIDMKPKFKVTGYQVVRSDKQRDTITLFNPITIDDIESYRNKLKGYYEGCKYVNLNYVLIHAGEDER